MTRLHNDDLFFRLFAVIMAAVIAFLLPQILPEYIGTNVGKDLPLNRQGTVTIPDSEKIIEFSQNPNYPTGCECASLYILLRYYGAEVTMEEIVDALQKGYAPHTAVNGSVYGSDPEKEFVGSPSDEHSYGVYEQPIAKTANLFLDGAVGEKGVRLNELSELLNDSPVIAWISLSPDNTAKTVWLDYQTYEDVEWVAGEHAVVVYGICAEGYMVSDPSIGEKRVITREEFEMGFTQHGGRVVYYKK